MLEKSIVIGRQYGTGGMDIGILVAKKLGYEFLAREIVDLAAEKENLHPDAAKSMDETAKNSFLYSIAMGSFSLGNIGVPFYYDMPLNDKLFLAQADVIKEKASKSPCVFVGRCADYVLKKANMPVLSVFIYADAEFKADRIAKRFELSPQKAKDTVNKIERQRKAYYDYYTSGGWGAMKNYDLCLDSSVLGIEKCADIIIAALDKQEDKN